MLESFRGSRTYELGFRAADIGTDKVVEEVEKAIAETESGPTYSSDYPSEILEGASCKLWENGKAIEPIIYLWDKFYGRIVSDGASQMKIGSGIFPNVMGTIAAWENGETREVVIESAIRFLGRVVPEDERINELLLLASALSVNGALKEGQRIVRIITAIKPDVMNNPQFQMTIEEAMMGPL